MNFKIPQGIFSLAAGRNPDADDCGMIARKTARCPFPISVDGFCRIAMPELKRMHRLMPMHSSGSALRQFPAFACGKKRPVC